MFIALTGTPGTGKTTIGLLLQTQGICVVDLHELALAEHITDGVDDKRNSVILDPKKLTSLVKKRYDASNMIVFSGHISHLLSCMDQVIVLRCRPDILKQRLQKKGWDYEKIRENLEAEIVDIILCESVALYGRSKVLEVNTTQCSPDKTASEILELITNAFSKKDAFTVGKLDWSDYADNEFLTGSE